VLLRGNDQFGKRQIIEKDLMEGKFNCIPYRNEQRPRHDTIKSSNLTDLIFRKKEKEDYYCKKNPKNSQEVRPMCFKIQINTTIAVTST
jgi:hypothetical protein